MRTVKTDRWAIAVNTSKEVVKNLSFNIASAASATLWGQWSASSLISRRGPYPGKFLVLHESMFQSFYCISDTGPTGIEGTNQTIFVRRIALRRPITGSYFEFFSKTFRPSERKESALQQFWATFSGIKQDWWVVEEPEDTQGPPAAALGASKSTDIEEASGVQDNGTATLMESNDVQPRRSP